MIDRIVFAADGDLLVELADGDLARTDGRGRAVRWRTETFGTAIGLQEVGMNDEGTVVVPMEGSARHPFIDALAWSDGQRRWLVEEQRPGKTSLGHAVSGFLPGGRSFHLVGVEDGYLLYHVDTARQHGWNVDLPGELMARLVITPIYVFVLGTQQLRAIEPASGRTVGSWDVAAGGRVTRVDDALLLPRLGAARIGVDIVAIAMADLSERVIGHAPIAGPPKSVGRYRDDWVVLTDGAGPRVSVITTGGRVGGAGERYAWQGPPQSTFPMYDLAPLGYLPFDAPFEGILGPRLPISIWKVGGAASLVWLDLEALEAKEDESVKGAQELIVRRLRDGWFVLARDFFQLRTANGGLTHRADWTPNARLGRKILDAQALFVGDEILSVDQGTVARTRWVPERATRKVSPLAPTR